MTEPTIPTSDPNTVVTPPPADTPATPAQDPGTFTAEQQERVNAIVGSRAKEASAAALSTLAKELGYSGVDEMKAAAKEAKARKDSEQTDLEKATQRAEKAEAKAAEAEAKALEVEAKRRTELINAELRAAASKLKAEYPKDVVKHLRDEYPDDVTALLGDDDKINEKLVETLVGKAKADRPTWFGNQASGIGSPSNRDGRVPQPGAKELQRASVQNQRRIRG